MASSAAFTAGEAMVLNSATNAMRNSGAVGSVALGGAATSNVALRVMGSNAVYVGSNANVGIGTNAPMGPLHVHGMDVNANSIYVSENNVARRLVLHGSTTFNQYGIFAYDYTSNASLPLLLQAAGGNVGIGTTIPSAKLDVFTNARISAELTPSMEFKRGLSTGIRTWGDSIYSDWKIGCCLSNSASFGIQCRYSSTTTDALAITYQGNVGIGINPTQGKLEVSGFSSNADTVALYLRNNANASGNSVTLGFGTGSGSLVGQAQITCGNDSTWGSGNGYISFKTYSDNMTEKMRITSGGNVGIGVLSPNGTIQFPNADVKRRIVFWETVNNDHQVVSIGKGISTMHFQNASTGDDFVFNVGTSSTTSAELFRVKGTGLVGIGTATPAYNLDVFGTNTQVNTLGTYFYYNTALTTGTVTHGVSIRAQYGIWTQQGSIISSSDRRIKTNIQDIDDGESLQQLRQLENKKYQYIDKVARGDVTVYGFIAQQVEEVMPFAVDTKSDIIPSVFSLADVTQSVDGVRITLRNGKTLPGDFVAGKEIRLYDSQNVASSATVKAVIDAQTFTIIEPLHSTEIFVYGHRVDDFKTLNKDAIFTVAVGAVQELDRKVQALESFIRQKFPGEF